MQDTGNAYAQNLTNFLGQGMVASMELLKVLLEMIEVQRRNATDLESAMALEALEEHVKDGGFLIYDSVDKKDAEIFRAMLRACEMLFIEFMVKDKETGRDRVLFCTRDTDQSRMDEVRQQYESQLHENLNRAMELEQEIGR